MKRDLDWALSSLTNRKPLKVSGLEYIVGSVINACCGIHIQFPAGTHAPSEKVNGDITFRGTPTAIGCSILALYSRVLEGIDSLHVTGFRRAVSFRKLSRYGISWLLLSKSFSANSLISLDRGSIYSGWRHRLCIKKPRNYIQIRTVVEKGRLPTMGIWWAEPIMNDKACWTTICIDSFAEQSIIHCKQSFCNTIVSRHLLYMKGRHLDWQGYESHHRCDC